MKTVTENVVRYAWQAGQLLVDRDDVVAEVAVALVYNGISHVVMMATPADLEDLALGFSLSEGVLQTPGQLRDIEVHEREQGIEVAMTISAQAFAALKQRRRNLEGRSGCGLCGVESLEQVRPSLQAVSRVLELPHSAVQQAIIDLGQRQSLKQLSGGVHGAAWCSRAGAVELVREDIGRHNALDKLLGALPGADVSPQGFVLVTSRASYEMVAKVANCDIPVLAAVSAPTSLAVQQADLRGVTLLGFVQPGRQVIYTHPERMLGAECDGA